MRDLVGDRVEPRLLGDPLDPQYRARLAAGEFAELVPRRALAGRREPVVDEEGRRARRPKQGAGVRGRVALDTVLVDGRLGGLAAEERRELLHRPPVRDTGGDVRPLPRVGRLGEQPAKLVERRPPPQDAVRMVIDEPDAVQYFEKWPCCSNDSSPAE
jgi:hypothetical protein